MGTIKKGINGPFRGKAGSVVGSSWKKINYIKGLPQRKDVNRIPSPEQAVQQQKFKLLMQFLNPMSKVLDSGFRQFLEKATGVNAAFRLNYDQAFLEEGERLALNYQAMQLSHGSLCMAGLEKAWLENGHVTVSWNTKTYGMGGEQDDVAHAVVYYPKKNFFSRNEQLAVRGEGKAHIYLFGNVPDEALHVWLFFTEKMGKRASKTVYIPFSIPAS